VSQLPSQNNEPSKGDVYGVPHGNPYADPYGTPLFQPADSKEQLERIIDILHRGKWIILGAFLACLAACTLYIYQQEASYRSSSLVMLAGEGQRTSQSEDELFSQSSPWAQWGRSIQSELLLLRNSEELARDVAQRLTRLPGRYDAQLRSLLFTPEGDSLTEQQLAQQIRGRVQFGASGDRLIQVQAVTATPQNAPLLANFFAEEYVQFAQRMSRSSLAASRDFLQAQLERQENELNAIEQRIEEYLSGKGTVSIESQGSQLVSKMGQLETRRDQIDIELERRRAALEALRASLETMRPQLAASLSSTVSQELALVQEKLAEKKAERQVALLNNPEWEGEDNPQALRRINRQIQTLEQRASALSEQYVAQTIRGGGARIDTTTGGDEALSQAVSLQQSITSEQVAIAGLQAERDAIAAQVRQYQSELRTVPGESIRIEKLRRDRERVAGMYDYITQRLQEVRIRLEGEQGYASVVAEAGSVQQVHTSRAQTLVLGAFLGIILGVGIVLIRGKFDNRIFKPDQLEEKGYNATLVPDMTPMIKAEYGGRVLVRIDGKKKVPTRLVTLHQGSSPSTEAYRQLRTNLQSSLNGGLSKVVLITSPGVGEGKSTTAANLAVALAKAGRRTLLLDADMRRPQVHNFASRSLEPGLYQILQQGMAFDPSGMETHTDNLFAIPAGRVAGGTASELLDRPQMGELLGTLREHFDVIIIDTPPALAVSEAKQLAPKADATLMVVRAGETKERDLDLAAKQLQRVGGRIIGVVLNGFNLDMAYGYRYRYSAYSQAGPYAEYAESK
jgi:capsular exopolysaccharide synthesis family protein